MIPLPQRPMSFLGSRGNLGMIRSRTVRRIFTPVANHHQPRNAEIFGFLFALFDALKPA